MKNLKTLLQNKTPKSTLNKIYENFLSHDLSKQEIKKYFIKFYKIFDYIINSKKDFEINHKLIVNKNEYGIFQILQFDPQKVEEEYFICEKIEYYIHLDIINKEKLSQDNLISFILWEIINCFEEEKEQYKKKRRNS